MRRQPSLHVELHQASSLEPKVGIISDDRQTIERQQHRQSRDLKRKSHIVILGNQSARITTLWL